MTEVAAFLAAGDVVFGIRSRNEGKAAQHGVGIVTKEWTMNEM